MISTDRFVYIHQPKTGGTFVSSVLTELSDLLNTAELLVRLPENRFVKKKSKHAALSIFHRRNGENQF